MGSFEWAQKPLIGLCSVAIELLYSAFRTYQNTQYYCTKSQKKAGHRNRVSNEVQVNIQMAMSSHVIVIALQ